MNTRQLAHQFYEATIGRAAKPWRQLGLTFLRMELMQHERLMDDSLGASFGPRFDELHTDLVAQEAALSKQLGVPSMYEMPSMPAGTAPAPR